MGTCVGNIASRSTVEQGWVRSQGCLRVFSQYQGLWPATRGLDILHLAWLVRSSTGLCQSGAGTESYGCFSTQLELRVAVLVPEHWMGFLDVWEGRIENIAEFESESQGCFRIQSEPRSVRLLLAVWMGVVPLGSLCRQDWLLTSGRAGLNSDHRVALQSSVRYVEGVQFIPVWAGVVPLRSLGRWGWMLGHSKEGLDLLGGLGLPLICR